MSQFLKIGNRIKPTPNMEGLGYDLIPGKVYDLKWDRFEGVVYLEENGSLNMPKKLYKLPDDDKFIKRVLNYFNSDLANSTTGVLLAGVKGTGKSILAKRLAIESELPIIVVDGDVPSRLLNILFKGFDTPVVIIFDEFEKTYDYSDDQSNLLTLLDGIEANTKKLVIMTCNDLNEVNDNFIDRCSRIRYFREYDGNSNDAFVEEMAKDKGIKDVKGVTEFIINHFKIKSFDNILSFLNEIVLLDDDNIDYNDLVSFMNISVV